MVLKPWHEDVVKCVCGHLVEINVIYSDKYNYIWSNKIIRYSLALFKNMY